MVATAPALLVGQAPDLATLRARAAASPDDVHAACELAFGLVGASESHEAITVATPAIARLRAQSGAAAARTLGACLYNRGRAHEALGETSAAIVDYADSLDLRPNDTVSARLAALVPDLGSAPPLAAIAVTVNGFAFGENTSVTRARDGARHDWLLVTSGRGENPDVVAVTRACGEPRAVEIDQGWFDNYGSLHVEGARARHVGALDTLVVEIGGAGDANCGSAESGIFDSMHTATAIVWLDACDVGVDTFVTQQLACEDADGDEPHDHGMRVRIDAAAGTVTTSRVRGRHADDREIGTFPITSGPG